MADTLVFLQMEHRTIVRLLGVLEAQCARIERSDPADLHLLQMVVAYFREYPDACHHPKEDLVFRYLQQRDAAAALQLADFLDGHQALEKLTLDVADLVGRAQHNGAVTPTELRAGLCQFVSEYRRHLDTEEQHFFPLVAGKLRREDWEALDMEMFDQPDPLYDESTESRFRELRQIIRAASDGSWPEEDRTARS